MDNREINKCPHCHRDWQYAGIRFVVAHALDDQVGYPIWWCAQCREIKGYQAHKLRILAAIDAGSIYTFFAR